MKSAVETLSPTRAKLTVEVPFEELKPSLDAAYKKIAQQISVPGFRKGKVPAAIIDRQVGRGAVLGLSSSNGTSTVSLARVGLRVSTALFTGDLLGCTGVCGSVWAPDGGRRRPDVGPHDVTTTSPDGPGLPWSEPCREQSGRQDSNLRSPAPKAGALATTLRPAKPAS